MNTRPAPARAINLTQYRLDAEQARALHRIATPWHPGSQASMDPVYIDRLNEWWAALGLELGFKWTTVADLTWHSGIGWWNQPPDDAARVTGATFTAEPEVAAVPDDADARAWFAARQKARSAMAHENWIPAVIVEAFAAGRDKGFAMGSATVDALEQQLAKQRQITEGYARKLLHDPDRMIAVKLLTEAAALFRMYERHHRDEAAGIYCGDESSKATLLAKAAHSARTEKAERNAEIAARIETYLAAMFRWKSVGDPREKDFGTGRPMEQSGIASDAGMPEICDPAATGRDSGNLGGQARKSAEIASADRTKAEHPVRDHMHIRRETYFDRLNRMVDESAPKMIGWDLAGKPDMHFEGTARVVGFDSRTGSVKVELDEDEPIYPGKPDAEGDWPTENGTIFELRQLLADAMPAITFVNALATIEDADLDTFAVAQLRNQARGSMGDDGFKRPGAYTEARRERAIQLLDECSLATLDDTARAVDLVAVALGLRLWTKDGPF